MARVAEALHLVEKGGAKERRKRVEGSPGEWDTGNWCVGADTAAQLQGCMIYLHTSQTNVSHIGGRIISYCESSEGPKRKVFRFQELADCIEARPPASGWGREKCIIWRPHRDNDSGN